MMGKLSENADPPKQLDSRSERLCAPLSALFEKHHKLLSPWWTTFRCPQKRETNGLFNLEGQSVGARMIVLLFCATV